MKLLLLTILLGISAASFKAHGCSCAEWEGASEILSQSDMVVLGVPTDNGQFYSSDPEMGEDLYRFGINIVKRFKGKYKKFMYVVSSLGNGANCGLYMKKYDGLYLLTGFKVPGEKYYYTTGCDVGYVTPDDEHLAGIIEDLLNN